MATFPTEGQFEAPIAATQFISRQEAFLAACKQLPGSEAITEVTIAGDAIAPTGVNLKVDTESNAAADNLKNIQYTNLRDGSIVVLWPENVARVVTVKHMAGGLGQCYLRSEDDYIMNHASACIALQRRGETWYELLRVDPARPVAGQQLFTANGTFTVPDNVRTVWVTAVGGGGGGGGGAGASGTDPNTANNGSVSSAGANSEFGSSVVVAVGGAGGSFGKVNGMGGLAGLGGHMGQDAGRDGTGGRAVEGPFSYMGQYGAGGSGGRGASDDTGNAGGSSGGTGGTTAVPKIRVPVDVSGASTWAVTVGAGGAGGAGGTGVQNDGLDGDNGAAGAVLVEWF